MPNPNFQFKQFTINQKQCAMKVTTDGCLFGAWCAEEIKKSQKISNHVLDIGTGTGLLSLMIAQKNAVVIDAIEIEELCAAQARENVQASPWAKKIQILHADVKQYQPNYSFDWIISNPPFYEKELRSNNNVKNTAHHSEHLTLSQLLEIIQSLLADDGLFLLLLPYKRKKEVERLLADQELFIVKSIAVCPFVLNLPFRMMLLGTKRKTIMTEETQLAIKIVNGGYTPAFISLLKDYYLYL